jgi:hypothetical protein
MIPQWVGWLWLGDRWNRVCEGDTLDACAAELGRIGRARAVPVVHQVLTGGAEPNFVPVTVKTRRRGRRFY